jgi:hypothetical protein
VTGHTTKLPRTIRLDASDPAIFERAAEPGEWAVSGSFMFINWDLESLTGKRRQAFANGLLGTTSFGWSTLVVVAEANEGEVSGMTMALAAYFLAELGAPDLDAAMEVAREEVGFAASLCDHPVNTLLAVSREEADGAIREGFRVIQPKSEKLHAPVWTIVEDDD